MLIGDGPLFNDVKKICEHEGILNKYIFLEGAKYNVQDYYSAAVLSIFSSLNEGLPTVILEAMIFNLPIVATDCVTGPREILGDNKYGLLSKVNDSIDMSMKINELLDNKELYKHYQKMGSKRIMDFKPENIKNQLNKLLHELV